MKGRTREANKEVTKVAIVQHSRPSILTEPFERTFFDWPVNPMVGLNQLLEDAQGLKVEEFTEDGQLVVRA
ncbi:MAG: hypothetical protein ACRDYC_07330, partial [Acidimicrobiales bacterium]